MTRLKLAIALYAAAAVVTFGHSATSPKVCPTYGRERYVPCESAQIAAEATNAALARPLYWSWTAWEAAG